ncbi:hypothetical protein E2C01_069157 [Portunus trituberculatus]|uniref:Uncharacterized protein n=1 Tax=Portunus trituberculatus TaxID=210409 RepID=A0A5B7HTV3_PORTR|nr:hypothetical protein [Portunus trituberculatus]
MRAGQGDEGEVVVVVDLRSDALTQPSALMKEAMQEAELGMTPKFGEDVTTHGKQIDTLTDRQTHILLLLLLLLLLSSLFTLRSITLILRNWRYTN